MTDGAEAQTRKRSLVRWGKAALPLGIVIGAVLGAAVGAALGHIRIGIAVGTGLGVGFGVWIAVAALVFGSSDPPDSR